MSDELKPMQVLLLWHLLAEGGGDWLKNVKGTAASPANRRRLLDRGLIEQSKRRAPGGRSPTLHFALTEEGWAWAADHLRAELPPRALMAGILQRVLGRLDDYLQVSGVSLAEFVMAAASAPPLPGEDRASSTGDLEARLRTAYFALTDGRANVRVRLKELRRVVRDADRAAVDAALLAMAREGSAALFRLDDPLSLTAEDHEAALTTPAGDPRHVIYIER